jgi:hypothetical protein
MSYEWGERLFQVVLTILGCAFLYLMGRCAYLGGPGPWKSLAESFGL